MMIRGGGVFLISEMRSEQLLKEGAQWGKGADAGGCMSLYLLRSELSLTSYC